MEILELRQKIQLNSKYKAKSKFQFWMELEVGDILEIRMPISDITSRGYVPRLKIKNINKEKWISDISLTEMSRYLNHLNYEII